MLKMLFQTQLLKNLCFVFCKNQHTVLVKTEPEEWATIIEERLELKKGEYRNKNKKVTIKENFEGTQAVRQ